MTTAAPTSSSAPRPTARGSAQAGASSLAGSAAIVGLADVPGLYVELTRWGATTIAALALVALFLVDRRREAPLGDIDGGGGSLAAAD